MKKDKAGNFLRIDLGHRKSKALSGYALVAMHLWFVLKLNLPSSEGLMELIVGLCALTGMIASIIFFVSTYGVLANAPDQMLDEREVGERYRAYFDSFKYLLLMTILGGMIPELMSKALGFELSVGVMKNFMLLMFTTGLVLPGTFLAWRDRPVIAED
jgi:hypothetical protein